MNQGATTNFSYLYELQLFFDVCEHLHGVCNLLSEFEEFLKGREKLAI
jgi:hypothetical protein